MQNAFFRTAGLAGLLLVVACGPSQTAEPEAASPPAGTASPEATGDLFRREAGLDYFGYYMADDSEIFGEWRLHHLFVGDAMMFTDFEAAGEPEGEAPVWLEFWPVGGETAVNELGQEYAVGSHRVRADSYIIESGRFELRAEDPEVGPVLLSGMIHPGAIENPASGPGFTGGMEVDGDRHRNMSLHYFAGD
jgi:hypothetical protein